MPGTVGAVIGATLEPSGFDLAGLGGVVLAPGFGVQGGTAADGAGHCSPAARPARVLPSVSRSLLVAGPDVAALRAAAATECGTLAEALG